MKVFPADVGGPSYIKAILAPLQQIQLIPTGGVNLDTTGPFLKRSCSRKGGEREDRRIVFSAKNGIVQPLKKEVNHGKEQKSKNIS